MLSAVDPDGTINPNNGASLSNPAALDSADSIVLLLRFRHWDDATTKRFDAAVQRATNPPERGHAAPRRQRRVQSLGLDVAASANVDYVNPHQQLF